MSVQTTYNDIGAIGLAGQLVGSGHDIEGKAAEGVIPFGYGVKRGTSQNQVLVGGGATFIGISQRYPKEPETVGGTMQYNTEDSLNVVRMGRVDAVCVNGCTAGQGIVVVDETGALRSGTAGSGQSQVDGTWESDADANGIAIANLRSGTAVAYAAGITATAVTTARSFVEDAAITPFTPLTAAGGTTPYVYYVASGDLPVGLILNSGTGAVSGTPTTVAAATTVTFAVRDAEGNEAATTSAVAITITAAG